MENVTFFRADSILKEIARLRVAGELKMPRDQLEREINTYGTRWNNSLGWLWRETLNTRWSQNYSDPNHDIYQWTNFFTGPLGGYNYINANMVQTYGLPPSCCHILIQQYIVQYPEDGQYYLSITDEIAIRMGFENMAGFIWATALPVLPIV